MTDPDDLMRYPVLNVRQTGLKGRCPRCGQGRLFSGFLKTADRCRSCNLEFDFIDSGDGRAVFVIFIVGFLVAVGISMTAVMFMPRIWLNMLSWMPMTLFLCLAFLRPLKGLRIARQYQRKATEGALQNDGGNSDDR